MRFLRWTVALGMPVVAVALLAFMLIPAEVWDEPENDYVGRGFDPDLLYVKETASGLASGDVQASGDELRITALNSSRPLVHLFTTPFDRIESSTDVRIAQNGAGSQPLRFGIWSPREADGFFLDFEGTPDNQIVARVVEDGVVGATLTGGEIVSEEAVGFYTIDQVLTVGFSLDKDAGIATFEVAGDERPPSGNPMLHLEGGPDSPGYRDIVGDPVRVSPGVVYTFGGFVKPTSGRDAYKVAVQWLDEDGASLGFDNDWRGVRTLDTGWNERQFTAEAPDDATHARLYLGSGNGTRVIFADLFLRRANADASSNLLDNGDLTDGDAGWQFVGGERIGDTYVEPYSFALNTSVTDEHLPGLFSALRLSYTAVAESAGSPSQVELTDYELTIPHQRTYGVMVSDPRIEIPFAITLAAAALLLLAQGFVYMRSGRARPMGTPFAPEPPQERVWFTVTRGTAWIAGGVVAYLVGNALLFGLGSHPFDMSAEKFWAHITLQDGPAALYYVPQVVSLADVWNGGPWHEAVFPYGAVLAYVFTGVGAASAVFLGGPSGLEAQSFGVEFTIKATVVLFGLANGILIFQIVKQASNSRRWGLVASAAFVFNPAVWFSMSIWGQTHVISVFFALLAVWFMFRENPTGAWLSLAACALTRPQMLIPVFLLAIVLFKLFPLGQNLRAAGWTVLAASLFMAPLTLAISPSLPVDVLWYQLYFQEAGGNESAQTIVSLGAFSVWPVVTALVDSGVGADRFHHLSSDILIGPLTYQRMSSLLSVAVICMAALVIFVRKPSNGPAAYLLPVAAGTTGFFMLKTGLAATHMLIVLPFLILCLGRVRMPSFWAMVAVWSFTTLASMWGTLGQALVDVERLGPALHPDNNPLSWLFVEAQTFDAFITVAAVSNALVLAWLWLETVWVSKPAPRPVEPVRFEGVTAFD